MVAIKHRVFAGAIDELRDLRSQEALQPSDAFRSLLREGEFVRHRIKPVGEVLEFVSCRYFDPVIEPPRADALRSLFQLLDRTHHAARKKVREQRRESGADQE